MCTTTSEGARRISADYLVPALAHAVVVTCIKGYWVNRQLQSLLPTFPTISYLSAENH
jgi:hypothetical protein